MRCILLSTPSAANRVKSAGMLTASELKTLLSRHGLRLTKRLGQNHLIDANTIQRLVDRCQFSSTETVLEIGAGLGALTEPIAGKVKQVIAVEIDRGIAKLLSQHLAGLSNVQIRCEDILQTGWKGLGRVSVVGAIPYHITSPILVALSENRQQITRAILILQEEVADRLCAKPSSKEYGRLTVLIQSGWEMAWSMRIPRSCFFPQPEVDSVCLALLPRRGGVLAQDEERLFGVVKAAFAQRRKTLANNLKGLFEEAAVKNALREMGLEPSARGETLSVEQFIRLAELLKRR